MQKRLVLVCEGSLCLNKLPDVSGPGLGEAGRYMGTVVAWIEPSLPLPQWRGSNDGGARGLAAGRTAV